MTAEKSYVTASSTALVLQPWPIAGETLTLGNDDVHVWQAALNHAPSQIDGWLHSLAEDEQARARKFHFPIDRERFIVARGVLREILGLYLNRAAQSVSFRYGPHGKPALADESNGNTIHFNTSHSHDVALYAVTRGREVGIDLEFIREGLEVEQIAERFSRNARLRRCVRFRSAFGNTRSFFVGLARKPTSRREVKGSHCPWTSSTFR